MKKFYNEYQIQRWCLKYYVLPSDLKGYQHVSKLPHPENFISAWSHGKALEVKEQLEDAYRKGYLDKVHEECL